MNQTPAKSTDWLDGAAIGLSGLCLLHCLALPFLVGVLPLLMPFAESHLHAQMLYFAVPLSIIAVGIGYARHRSARVVVAAAAGLALLIVGATVALFASSRDYNALSLGEEGALQLGVEVEALKRRTFVLGSLLTALAVSVAGLIGFVGLIVPHVLRLLIGPDHRLLLPGSFLGGAAFLVLADLISRLLIAPNELPVGVVTALVGGPFFLYLLRRRSGSHGFA